MGGREKEGKVEEEVGEGKKVGGYKDGSLAWQKEDVTRGCGEESVQKDSS